MKIREGRSEALTGDALKTEKLETAILKSHTGKEVNNGIRGDGW